MGLSATSPLAWANTTHLTYLLSPEGRKYYTIAALCNSSPAAAAAAISAFHLPSTTKAYGSPEALANDPDIDLVVVSVNVAKHYALVKPALLAGKAAFVEWPLGANLAEAEELAGIARERGVRTIVGLQGRLEPLVDTIRGIVDSGNIGEVLSSSVVAAASQVSSQEVPALRYFLDSKTGGTITSIHFAHCKSPGVVCGSRD